MFSVIAMQRFDFKNRIIAIKLYLVMILNLYLSLILWWLCFKGDYRMPIFLKIVFSKWSQWSCSHSQQLFSLHISLHANEFCSPRPSLPWKSKGDSQIIIKNIKCETFFFWRCNWIMNYGYCSILIFYFLTKLALNCPSFRKQSGEKWST